LVFNNGDGEQRTLRDSIRRTGISVNPVSVAKLAPLLSKQ